MKKGRFWLVYWSLVLVFACSPREEAAAEVSGPAAPPLVALTFDDGPHPEHTRRLLEGLALREIPATFFLVGERLEGNGELVKEMAAAGHQIGIHTWDHVCLSGVTPEEFGRQTDRTRQALTGLLGEGAYWLRPPYGILDPPLQELEEGPVIIWSVDPEDWRDRDTRRIVRRVLSRVEDGDIILLHDIYAASVEGALAVADALLERGFCFVTVEQLMALRGVEPRPGQRYDRVGP